jgi:hypothetical protein
LKFTLTPRTTRLILGAIACLVLILSVVRSIYHVDPLHFGLMLSNAHDLLIGKRPYQEIFIQYGLLTTTLHAAAMWVSERLLSLMVITAIFYSAGLLLLYFIALKVINNRNLSLAVLVIAFLFHPVAIYPWANYMAFPFLMGAIYFLVNPKNNLALARVHTLTAGALLGLATLCRDGLILTVACLIIGNFAVGWIAQPKLLKQKFIELGQILLGLAIPLLLFFGYLFASGLESYWFLLSVALPKINATHHFTAMSSWGFMNRFWETVFLGSLRLDFRWILALIMAAINIFICTCFALRIQKYYISESTVKLALFSLALFSSALHLTEIFRIATGSIVGLIPTLIFINSRGWLKPFILGCCITLGVTLIWRNDSLMFYPNTDVLRKAGYVSSPAMFAGQLWNAPNTQYYQEVDETFSNLKKLDDCKLQYHHNSTGDAFIATLSPFTPYQISPFANDPHVDALRPDLNYQQKIAEAKDIVVLKMIPLDEVAGFSPPPGFYTFKQITVPDIHYIPSKHMLMVVAPLGCKP